MAILVEYNQEWSKLYKAQAKLIKKTLGIKCTGTYHIGATAIKDMPARPVIDILVVLSDEKAAHGLFVMGYKPAADGSYILYTDEIDYSVRLANRKDYQAVAPYLAIPFYLSDNKQAAAEFAQKKRALAEQFAQDPEGYQTANKQLLDEISPIALEYKLAADKRSSYMAIGMCLGCGVGMCFGVAFDNIGIGMCIGMSVGMCLGLALGAHKDKPNDKNSDK